MQSPKWPRTAGAGLLWWRHVRWRIVCGVPGSAARSRSRGEPVALCAFQAGRTARARRNAVRGAAAADQPEAEPESAPQAILYGVMCTTLMLLTGVSDSSSTASSSAAPSTARDRGNQIGVPAGHGMKLAYFTVLVDQAASSIRSWRRSRSQPRCSAPRWRGRCWNAHDTQYRSWRRGSSRRLRAISRLRKLPAGAALDRLRSRVPGAPYLTRTRTARKNRVSSPCPPPPESPCKTSSR